MGAFLEKFRESIDSYWELEDEEQEQLFSEMKQFIDQDSEKFKSEFKQEAFTDDSMPLGVMLEFFQTDLDKWMDYVIELLNELLRLAKKDEDPILILLDLSDFCEIEMDSDQSQRIIDVLLKEMNACDFKIKSAALWNIPYVLSLYSARNERTIIEKLRTNLTDTDWRIRYIAYESLKDHNFLPEGAKLSFGDKLRKMIQGAPQRF